jgi:hypothetical protein
MLPIPSQHSIVILSHGGEVFCVGDDWGCLIDPSTVSNTFKFLDISSG